jgi:hypothetical protein
MATIDETAIEVAEAVLVDLGNFDEYPELRAAHLEVATKAAIRMSQRLGKSIDAEQFLDKTLEFQSRAVEISQSHTQVIILAGYAAFFALWSAMALDVSRPWALLSGFLMIVSVIIFVGWTVAGLVFAKVATERAMAVYQSGPVDFWERYQEAERNNLQGRSRIMWFWKPVVATAGSTALLAASTLGISSAAAFVHKIEKGAQQKACADGTKTASAIPTNGSPAP